MLATMSVFAGEGSLPSSSWNHVYEVHFLTIYLLKCDISFFKTRRSELKMIFQALSVSPKGFEALFNPEWDAWSSRCQRSQACAVQVEQNQRQVNALIILFSPNPVLSAWCYFWFGAYIYRHHFKLELSRIRPVHRPQTLYHKPEYYIKLGSIEP